MKRTMPLILALLFLLVGCRQEDVAKLSTPTTPISSDSPIVSSTPIDPTISKPGFDSESIVHRPTLSDEDQEKLSAFIGGPWIMEVTNCGHDYEFTVTGTNLRYHSDCGTFTNITGDSSLTLTNEDREIVNAILAEYIPSVKLIRYDWSGRGLSEKTIQPGETATALAQMLDAMEENGQVVPKISDDSLDDYSSDLPVDRGTMWIEIGTDLYRITPGFTQLCRVDSHLGVGYVLDMSPEFAALLAEAWQYFPFNYYSGTYDNETNEIKLEHKREAPSTVQIQIKSLEVYDSFDSHNKIVLEVTSTIDQTVSIEMTCQQSEDNLGLGDHKELIMSSGQTETVELTFIGFKFQHWIEIRAGNTFIYLTIIP